MLDYDYTAKEALDLLIRKIDDAAPALATQLRSAINAGKDMQVEKTIEPTSRINRVKKRYYRKHVAFTDVEALGVAMTVLESHLIESRMLVNAAHDQFKQVGLADPKKPKSAGDPGAYAQTTLESGVELTDEDAGTLRLEQLKEITIESEPEAVQEKRNLPDIPFVPINEEQLSSLRELFASLTRLTDFKEASHGNA